MKRLDAAEALARWRALLEGTWIVVGIREENGRRGLLTRRAGPGCRAALTPREQQVAVLAARGRSLKDIAHELGVTSSTVGTHLANARRKLGAQTRAELAALFGGVPESASKK